MVDSVAATVRDPADVARDALRREDGGRDVAIIGEVREEPRPGTRPNALLGHRTVDMLVGDRFPESVEARLTMATSEHIFASLEHYLTDHLAGAEGALDLMDDLREKAEDEDFAAFIRRLHDEVTEDRDQLLTITERFGASPGRVKRTLASAAETLGRTGLAHVGEPAHVSRLLAIETLSSGIWTKMRLWQALQAAPDLQPGLADVDLSGLIRRARQQLDALEPHHEAAARRTLSRAR